MTEEALSLPKAQVEETARAMGWKEDGDKTAVEYLLDSPKYLNRQHDARKDLQARLERQESHLDELRTTLAQRFERETKREKQTLDERIEVASKDGDSATVQKLIKQRDELQPPKLPETKQQPETDPAVEAWLSRNSWYQLGEKGPMNARTAEADGFFRAAITEGRSTADALATVDAKMARLYDAPSGGETRTAKAGGNKGKPEMTDQGREVFEMYKDSMSEENLMATMKKRPEYWK